MPDDDDRPGDDLTVAWSTAVAPDDISELAGDIKAYHRERRADRRRVLFHRVYDRRGAAPVTMAIAALALVAIVLTLLSLTAPASSRRATSVPKASPTAAAGQTGGLLPNDRLVSVSETPVSAQSLPTPGVVAIMPDKCDCLPLLNQVADDADAAGLPLSVVAPGGDAEAASLRGRIDHGTRIYSDAAGDLAHELGPSGITVVLVNRDATIYTITRSLTAATDPQLTAPMLAMLATKTPAG